MINKIIPFVACFFMLYGTNALGTGSHSHGHSHGSDCIRIYGKIHTNTLNVEDPSSATLGTLSLRTRWGRKSCAIQGKIVGANKLGFPELTHQISCNDNSIFNTTDSISEFSPIDECLVYIEQDTILTPISENFKGYTGKTFLRGTINQCSGENDFRYKGYLCLAADDNK